MVLDQNTLKGQYRLARVKRVFTSQDGRVRRATVEYRGYKTGEKIHEYSGGSKVEVERSVQRLVLITEVSG